MMIKFTHHTQSGERGVRDQAQAFPGEVVNHGQDAEAPAADQHVHPKSSDQVPVLWDRHRRLGAKCGAPTAAPFP